VIAGGITVLLAVSILLGSLDSQSNKWVYIFQEYVLGYEPLIGIPENYTGEFRNWHWNGQLAQLWNFKDGMTVGEFRTWDEDGSRGWVAHDTLENAPNASVIVDEYGNLVDIQLRKP
jgi:antitoxin component YwqK of YwqJK toxin-antitoxin module